MVLLLSFVFFSGGALFVPMIGVVGYVLHYHFWPDNQWWGKELSDWGLRYAFTVGLCLLIGTLINKHKLKLCGQVMKGHEWLLVMFWLAALLSVVAGADLALREVDRVYQATLLDKLSKVILFCLLMSHVVTTPKRLDLLLWTMILGTLYTAYQAWEAPVWKFSRARLDGIGGPDFRESSFLGAHFAMMLPLIGVQFLRGGWRAKALCLVAGGFAVNGLILTRTRAAFVAVCVGAAAAMVLSLRGRRRRIVLYLLPGILAGVVLTDTGFRERMRSIETNPTEEDSSAFNRLLIWEAAGQMFLEHPLGVGVGNFGAEMGRFNRALARRDAHNTFIRCATEAGILGIALLAAMILSGFACLRKAQSWAWRCPHTWQLRYYVYGVGVSLLVMLTSSMFMTQLYIEEFWWLLTLPVCVLRAAEFEYERSVAEAGVFEEKPGDEPDGLLQPAPAAAPLGWA